MKGVCGRSRFGPDLSEFNGICRVMKVVVFEELARCATQRQEVIHYVLEFLQ